MSIYNLIEYSYSDNYSRTSGSLWKYYGDEPCVVIRYSESFKSKGKITESTPDNGKTKDAEIAVPLKYISHFYRAFEMPLITCEINVILPF